MVSSASLTRVDRSLNADGASQNEPYLNASPIHFPEVTLSPHSSATTILLEGSFSPGDTWTSENQVQPRARVHSHYFFLTSPVRSLVLLLQPTPGSPISSRSWNSRWNMITT